MSYKFIIRNILLLIMFFCAFSATAKNSLIEEFKIRPGLCIVEAGKPCRQSFIFYWRLSEPLMACIYQGKRLKPLTCEAQQEVEKEFFLDINLSDEFNLKVAELSQSQQVLVRQLGKDVRQARRHLWSVF